MKTPSILNKIPAALMAVAIMHTGTLYAQTAPAAAPTQAATPAPGSDLGWPREFTAGDDVVTVYQPQVDKWDDHKVLHLRAALSISKKSETSETLAVLSGTADTIVNTGLRTVALSGLQYTLKFPGKSAEESAPYEAIVRQAIPGTKAVSISLDRVLAYMNPEDSATQKNVDTSMTPPTIYYSPKPANLVIFMGTPKFSPVKDGDNSLLYAVNTNWDLFQSVADEKYYLRDGDSWLESKSRGEGWEQAGPLPTALQNLPDNENWSLTKEHIPGTPAKTIPIVYETTVPAELIITNGPPQMDQIAGVNIMRITNTDSELFLCGTDQKYYFLVAGRWFSAKSLEGPWESATFSLPAEFAKIPPTGEGSEVLSSVKGTPEADDAVLLASVPTKATVPVGEASLTVTYDGEPKFIPIPNINVEYAVNTSQDVFLVNNKYYCCSDGVWFDATAATGPWALCTVVPPAIYEIPVSSPKHNVTYVNVYNSTPDTVTYGYTAGYTGSYVNNGLLVFGAGLIAGALLNDDSPEYNYHIKYPYPPTYYSYGMAAHYNYAGGGYYGYGGAAYGPYGGAGRYGAYNPSTGFYSRGAAAYGPNGSAGVRQAYNPWTNTYAARGQVNTKNGSASRFYAQQNGNAVWGGSRSNNQGTVAGARNNNGGAAAAWDGKYNQGAAVKNKQGDMVVGNDGNIYKKQDGSWSKYDDGSWQSANRPNNDLPNQRNNNNNEFKNNTNFNGNSANRSNNDITVNNNKAVNLNNSQNNRAQQIGNQNNLQRNSANNMNRDSAQSAMGNRNLNGGNSQFNRPDQSFGQSNFDSLNRQSEARSRGNANTERFQNSFSGFEGGNRNFEGGGRSFEGGGRSFEGGGRSGGRSFEGGGRSGGGRGRR